MILGAIEIKDNNVYINGSLNRDPETIGLTLLQEIERGKTKTPNNKHSLEDFIKEVSNVLKEHLKRSTFHLTEERRIILTEIHCIKAPFTAKDLLFEIEEKNKDVSKATIYKNINLFLKTGIIKQRIPECVNSILTDSEFELNNFYYN